jgi:(S)-2-hydroxy-acid oxidase
MEMFPISSRFTTYAPSSCHCNYLTHPLEFFNSGSTDQATIKANSTSLNRLLLRSRVLVDVSTCTTKTTLWDKEISFPLGVAPAGLQGMAHPIGEIGTSKACAKKGVPMAVSSFANYGIQEIRDAALLIAGSNTIPNAMQLYTMQDRALQLRVIRRAEAAGCKAIFLTTDSPVLGVRFNEWRNDFRTPSGLGYPNLEASSDDIRNTTHDSKFATFNDNAHSWERDIPYLRSVTKMEIWIKGVLCAEDVERAVEAGVEGVIVSNHGGRQLDGVPATIDALPECVGAARGRVRVHVDGGFRRGADIFRALALGAEFVWVGRPAIWGLAVSIMKSFVDELVMLMCFDVV